MGINFIIKTIKYWIDNVFRDKVEPVEGSVLYSDLYFAVEHSGIYIGNNQISNIVVDGFMDSTVKSSSPQSFVDGGWMHNKIYVSCNSSGAVGDLEVSTYAKNSVGEKSFYGLVFSNCHEFSEKCLYQSDTQQNNSTQLDLNLFIPNETWELTLKSLKSSAKSQLGATKWRLWDNSHNNLNEGFQPNFEELEEDLYDMELSENSIDELGEGQEELEEYLEEIYDENIPNEAIKKIEEYQEKLKKVQEKYEEAKEFIEELEQPFSYNDLLNIKNQDFSKFVEEFKSNKEIDEIIRKLGNNYISKEKKETLNRRMPNEVHGVHKSNDLSRVFPCELLSIDDEDLEYLFYAKFLESNLLSYELDGKNYSFDNSKTKGPIVVCFDTSRSMKGKPILKARALLFSINKILKKENREMYILIFGNQNQIREIHVNRSDNSRKLLQFLYSSFDGGTNFETPLKRSFEIIEDKKEFENADILMVTDGRCDISDDFKKILLNKKQTLGFEIYTIICENEIVRDDYSSEVVKI